MLKAIPDLIQDYPRRTIGLIGNISHKQAIQTEDFLSGIGRQLIVYGSDILFCDKNDFARIERFIPGSFIVLLSKENSLSGYQTDGYFNGNLAVNTSHGSIKQPLEVRRFVNEEMKSKSWAGEIAWRLCRIQELFLLSELAETRDEQRGNYQKAIQERIPQKYQDSISNTIGLITEIALPSIIQLLQKGVSNRSIVQNRNETTLNRGFSEIHLRNRHTLVEYQHRMHSDIAAFSAKHIYEGKALNNGHIIDRSWSYTRYPYRAYWLDVPCIEKKNNENSNEVDAIIKEIRFFAEYAKTHPKKNGEAARSLR